MRPFQMFVLISAAIFDGCAPNKGHPRPVDWVPKETEKHIPSRCKHRFKVREEEEELAAFYYWVAMIFEGAFVGLPLDSPKLVLEDYLLTFFYDLFSSDATCKAIFKVEPQLSSIDLPSETMESMKNVISSCFNDRGASCVDTYSMHMHEPDEMLVDTKYFYSIRTADIFVATRPWIVKLLRIEVVSPGGSNDDAFICSLFDDHNPLSKDAWEIDPSDAGMTIEGDVSEMWGLLYDWKPDVYAFLNFCLNHVHKSVAVRVSEVMGEKERFVMNDDPRETRFTVSKSYILHVPFKASSP